MANVIKNFDKKLKKISAKRSLKSKARINRIFERFELKSKKRDESKELRSRIERIERALNL